MAGRLPRPEMGLDKLNAIPQTGLAQRLAVPLNVAEHCEHGPGRRRRGERVEPG